jgi:hypothetical protein
MAAVINAWQGLGLHCDEETVGMPDAVPEWNCSGAVDGSEVSAHLVGGASGPQRYEVELTGSVSTEAARSVFVQLAKVTPVGGDTHDMMRLLQEWDGSDVMPQQVGGVRSAIDITPEWMRLLVSLAG